MNSFKPLPRSFFKPSAREVAPRLLGQLLVRRTEEGFSGGPIVETEAYLWDDPACHAAPGPTSRNQVMFGPPGHAYVYFIYGVYYCVNAVCCPAGKGEAVLIRAVEPALGLEFMRRHRAVASPHALTSGPGKICCALHINRAQNGADLCDAGSDLWIARNPELQALLAARGPILTSTRIGLTKAADLHLRFFLKNSPWLSKKAAARVVSEGETAKQGIGARRVGG